eukprot:3730688-Prymnesium_polylepis.1
MLAAAARAGRLEQARTRRRRRGRVELHRVRAAQRAGGGGAAVRLDQLVEGPLVMQRPEDGGGRAEDVRAAQGGRVGGGERAQ